MPLIVLQMGLKVGQTLTPEQLVQLRSEELLQQAVDRALNFLSFRPRSREEVRRYLKKKETPPELIDTVLERLDRLDFVNDRAFASFWIESREQFNPRGSNVLKNELRMKGVDRDVVDELVSDEKDEERALVAGRKKAASLMRLPDMDLQDISHSPRLLLATTRLRFWCNNTHRQGTVGRTEVGRERFSVGAAIHCAPGRAQQCPVSTSYRFATLTPGRNSLLPLPKPMHYKSFHTQHFIQGDNT